MRLLKFALSLLLIAPQALMATQCIGTYQEPGGVFTWTFFGSAAIRTDNACTIASGSLTCINGFNQPVTLFPDATCSTISSSFPWLNFIRVGSTPPQASVASLLSFINSLYAQKLLNSGQANSLTKQLVQSLKLIQAGHIDAAVSVLDDYIAEVNDLLASRVLGQVQGAVLIDAGNVLVGKLTLPSVVYVSDRSGNLVNAVDPSMGIIDSTILGIPKPQLMTLSLDGQSLYVTTYDANGPVYVASASAHAITSTIPVGQRDHGVAITPDGSRVLIANLASGTISVINTATNSVIDNITLGGFPTDIAITPDGAAAYVTDAFENVVRVVAIPSGSITAVVPVGAFPVGIATSPDNQSVYVANTGSSTVSVIRRADNTVVNTIAVQAGDWGLAASPDGRKIYVGSETSTRMSVIDTATWTAASILLGVPTSDVRVTKNSRYVYAASRAGVLVQIDTTSMTPAIVAQGLGEAVAVAVPPR
jgi:YVTN family beta-propeller protein